jgi:hypothetical protein
MFTKDDCHKCEWNEAYFDRLAKEELNKDFVFAKMDISKNYPTSDLRRFLVDRKPGEAML